MLILSRVIVLRTLRYNDDTLIAHCYSASAGLVSLSVRITRSPRAAVRHALFQPLALLEVEWTASAQRELGRCRSARLAVPTQGVAIDPTKRAIALFLAEFLEAALRSESAGEGVFDYIISAVKWLDMAERGVANFHLVFLLRLSLFLGIAPNVDDYRREAYFDLRSGTFVQVCPPHPDYLPPAEAMHLPRLLRINFPTMHAFRFTRSERNALLRGILTYYRLHLPAFPTLRSLEVLTALFD
ncbi:MAG: DNA repair protein RecO C-terminal domain-containing protein [Bacteroidales bacterium]|nr:DNA repair protein RecO C-terminal domain-containing protein [Candidatus Equimonas enterica]